MAEKEFFIDDNVKISDDIKKMSLEEIESELKRLIDEDKKRERLIKQVKR